MEHSNANLSSVRPGRNYTRTLRSIPSKKSRNVKVDELFYFHQVKVYIQCISKISIFVQR